MHDNAKAQIRMVIMILCVSFSLSIMSVIVGRALVFLIMITKCPSAVTIRALGKNAGLLLTRCGNHTAAWGQTATSQVERGRAKVHGLEFCFYWV